MQTDTNTNNSAKIPTTTAESIQHIHAQMFYQY